MKKIQRRIGHGAAAHGGAPSSSPRERARATPARWPRMASDFWPRRARRFARCYAVDERWSRAPRCAMITHLGRCVSPVLGALSRLKIGHWPHDVAPPIVRWPRDWHDGGRPPDGGSLHVDACWALVARPAKLRRCRDGRILLGFGSGMSRAAREVFWSVYDIGPVLVDFEILRFLGLELF
ncbi:hypothetical protein F511_46455 [Dorcoceras hygrometricum]|uniref:Uncharacterized protein n=1 Tax=Dorcoceras hygrometricum TaxID=472368 RepID=A0A2Z6ZUL1_9LAMI|nr:hypothetical protein F511_46455 [Dorcoceras hygrometricum]